MTIMETQYKGEKINKTDVIFAMKNPKMVF